jgi:putative flavoprotein involved in K+ transport
LREGQLERGLALVDEVMVAVTAEVANVIWCTGFEPGFSWIDLPIFDERAELLHDAGVATKVPGLYFVGLGFLYAMSSSMIHGVGRDADRIVKALEARLPEGVVRAAA